MCSIYKPCDKNNWGVLTELSVPTEQQIAMLQINIPFHLSQNLMLHVHIIFFYNAY